MLGGRDEQNFQQVWAQKSQSGQDLGEYHPGANQRVDFCLRYLPAGECFLDIGCGTGILAAQLKGRYREVHGIDIAELPVQIACQNQVRAVQHNLNTAPLPYSNDYFDTVTVLSTLQYFYDLDFAVGEIRRVLKPGGLVVLTVPNMRAFWRLAKLALKGEFPTTAKDEVGYDGGALHYFCYANLAGLLARYGLKPVYKGGIFCIPAFLNSVKDGGGLGALKREFFSAEVVIAARKEA